MLKKENSNLEVVDYNRNDYGNFKQVEDGKIGQNDNDIGLEQIPSE